MKTLITLILMLVLEGQASASEQWRCTEEGITREGNTFVSCGMSVDYKEDIAKENALIVATTDFQMLCDIDTGCKNHEVTVNPGRTTCEKLSNDYHYKCFRIVRFTIGGKL